MRTRTRNILIAVGVLLAAAIVVVVAITRPSDKGTVKIGADFTLTGNTAFWSQTLKKGLDLAVEEVNQDATPGTPKVVIVYEDNQGTPANAISAWRKLDSIDHVGVVISCFTPIGQPLRENAAESKLPLLATVTSAKDFGAANEWSFRDFIPQDQQCPAIARYAFDTLNLRAAGCLVVNDDYGKDGLAAFRGEFDRLHGKIVATETFEQKDTDIRAQLLKVTSQNPDCLFIIGRDQSLALCIKQARELGFKGKILSINGFDADVVWRLVGDAGEGVVFSSAYVDFEKDAEARAFRDRYVQRYKEPPDYTAVYGYTIGKYLGRILQATHGDRDRIRAELAKLNAGSIRGQLKMTAGRDVLSAIGVYVLESGHSRLLQKMD